MSDEQRAADETASGQPRGGGRTHWHQLLGKLLELLLTPVGITVLTEVPVMSEPPKADILLLRRTGARWTSEQANYLPDGVRTSVAHHILLEFKYRETVGEQVFQQALGYDYFYRQGQRLAREAVETFVVSGQTPQRATLNEFGYMVAEQPGVYRSQLPLLRLLPLLVLNELGNEPHNAFVKLFATRQRVQQAALALFTPQRRQRLPQLVWRYIVGLEAGLAVSGGKMIEELTPELVLQLGDQMRQLVFASVSPEEREQMLASASPEERKQMLASASPEERKQLLASASPEERQQLLASASPEERKQLLASVSPEERQQLLASASSEERLVGLSPEELVALVAQIEAYLRTQKK